MNNDTVLYVEVYGRYRDLPRAEAVKRVADARGLTVSGVSGMVTRAHATLPARLALMQFLASQHNEHTPAINRINAIVERGRAQNAAHHKALTGMKAAVFVSDIHFPLADWDALELTYKLVEKLDKWYGVSHVSALSDVNDNAGLATHHKDKRQPEARVFDKDISRTIDLHGEHMSILCKAAPNALQISVPGNHDGWLMIYGDQTKEARPVNFTLMADMMERFEAQGVTFTRMIAEGDFFHLNERLAWVHGVGTTASAVTRVKKALKAYQLSDDARANRIVDIVSGHLHKHNVTRHPDVADMTLYESGALCQYDMSYLNTAPAWTTGVVVSIFDPHSGLHDTHPVVYRKNKAGKYEALLFGQIIK